MVDDGCNKELFSNIKKKIRIKTRNKKKKKEENKKIKKKDI